MTLLKAETITIDTNSNVLDSPSPSLVQQFTLDFTHFYDNLVALSLQQKGWRTD